MICTLKKMLKMRVVTMDGKYLGKLNDISVNENSKEIVMVQIEIQKKAAKEMGVEVKILSSPTIWISRGDVKAIEDVVLLNEEVGHLKSYFKDRKFTAEHPPSGVPIKQFLDKEVVTVDGIIIGTVADAVLDTRKWEMLSLTLKADKRRLEELGLPKSISSARVDIAAKYVQSFGESYVTLTKDGKSIVRVMSRPKLTKVKT